MDISININQYNHAQILEHCSGDFSDLHKVTEKFEYSASVFREGKRNNTLAHGATLLIFDFDDGTTLKEGINLFKEYKALIVTTKSHLKEKKGLVAERFRVILPLNICLIDMLYYSKLMQLLTRYYRSDIACTDAARYYSPNPKQIVHYTNGDKFFDPFSFDEILNTENNEHTTIHKVQTISKVRSSPSTSSLKINLEELLNSDIHYYQAGVKHTDTLQQIINITSVSKKAIACHCFLNPKHEDIHHSCFIYHNTTNIYAKCLACGCHGTYTKETQNV